MPSVEEKDLDKLGWSLGKELGSGHFAKVKLATRKSDGITAAVKIIKKPKGAISTAQCLATSRARPRRSQRRQHVTPARPTRRPEEACTGGQGA